MYLLIAVLFFALSACSVAIAPRAVILEQMPRLVQVETRAKTLITVAETFGSFGMLPAGKASTFKEHYDMYYVYHAAAMDALVAGHLERFDRLVKLMDEELNAMAKLLVPAEQKPSAEKNAAGT